MVSVQNYHQSFGKRSILTNLNFQIQKGEIVGLIGPSGSGKTTLIKTLIGLQRPTQGEVSVLGHQQPTLAISKEIGYMAQSDALYEDLSARGNVTYFGKLYGLRKGNLEQRVNFVLEFVDLLKDADRPVRYFSGGMKRRLSLAIALVHQPRFLLLDEPTVGIDPTLKQLFWKEFESLRESGVTLLITTHIMDEAERCDRLLLIQNGQLVVSGTPDQLKQQFGSIEHAFIRKEEV
ncbi:MAG: ABC transporter ATP-binding protein [Paenisporosarcina sp.]|nr:ABC transporter ATP-binding protein [Paenisporosarcina sp.]